MAILFITTVLVNALWQPIVIAGIAWAVLRISRCTNATTRSAIWTVALVASVALPVISAAPLVLSTQSPTSSVMEPLPRKVVPAVVLTKNKLPAQPPTMERPLVHVRPTFAQLAAALWAAIAVIILARVAFSFIYLERLKRDALPLSVERRNELRRWERAEKGTRDVRVCVSHEITVPVAVGIFDAMIVLPHDLVDELDPSDLDRILLHELAHVRRSDDWVNLFERIVLALFFFSPGVYVIARQMDLEREVACDDWVLAQAAENVPYARCLTRIVEMTQWPHQPVAAPGVFVTRKSMSIRIERLLARGRDVRIRLAVVPSLVSIVAIAAIVIAGGFVSPTIAYTMNATTVALKAAAAPKPVHHKAHAAPPAPTAPPSVAVAALSTATPHEPPAPHPTSKAVASIGYLDELAAAGLTSLSADEVVQLKSVGVNGAYIRSMRDAGFANLSPRQLIEFKSVGVTPDYVSMMRNSGLDAGDAQSWVELKSIGVTPEYAAQMKTAGVSDFDARQLSELKSVGVTPQYIVQMRNAGLGAADARTWTEMKSIGLTSDYVQQLSNAGYSHLSTREYTELKAIGVTPAYIQNLAKHGFTNLSARKLLEFKAEGIDPQ